MSRAILLCGGHFATPYRLGDGPGVTSPTCGLPASSGRPRAFLSRAATGSLMEGERTSRRFIVLACVVQGTPVLYIPVGPWLRALPWLSNLQCEVPGLGFGLWHQVPLDVAGSPHGLTAVARVRLAQAAQLGTHLPT